MVLLRGKKEWREGVRVEGGKKGNRKKEKRGKGRRGGGERVHFRDRLR